MVDMLREKDATIELSAVTYGGGALISSAPLIKKAFRLCILLYGLPIDSLYKVNTFFVIGDSVISKSICHVSNIAISPLSVSPAVPL